MAVSLWELDYSRAGDMLRALHRSGIVRLGTYFTGQPLRRPRALAGNACGGRKRPNGDPVWCRQQQELLTNIEPYWPEESWGDYIAAVVSSFSGDKFSTETRLRKPDGTLFDAHLTTWYPSENKPGG